jgi:hypothetical protein
VAAKVLAEGLGATGEETDAVFRALASDGVLGKVAPEARFDWHRGVILAMLRHSRLSRLLLRKAVFRAYQARKHVFMRRAVW